MLKFICLFLHKWSTKNHLIFCSLQSIKGAGNNSNYKTVLNVNFPLSEPHPVPRQPRPAGPPLHVPARRRRRRRQPCRGAGDILLLPRHRSWVLRLSAEGRGRERELWRAQEVSNIISVARWAFLFGPKQYFGLTLTQVGQIFFKKMQ